jgi:hypothetical protein
LVAAVGSARAEDKAAPAGRTKSDQTCADLFALLAPRVEEERAFSDLRVNPGELPDGAVFFSKRGKMVLREYGVSDPYKARILDQADAARAIAELAKAAESLKREVITTGDMPLDLLVQQLKKFDLAGREKWFLISTKPSGRLAAAKRRLLGRSYTHVEVVVDVPVPSDKVAASLRSVAGEDLPLPTTSGAVKYIAARDLPGAGTVAQRLAASRPAPGALRVTVTHHSNGLAKLSDGSELPLADLGAKRVTDGDMDVYIGCNLIPQEAGWLVIRGKVLGQEIALLGSRMADILKDGKAHTGSELLAEAGLFDRPGNGSGGGGDRSGGSGNQAGGAGAGDGGGKPRPSFRLLEVIGTGLALALASEAGAADDDDDEEKKKRRGGLLPTCLAPHAGVLRVGGRDPWFGSAAQALAIYEMVMPGAIDRPTLYLDDAGKHVMLFEPSRGAGVDLPEPAVISKLHGERPAAETPGLRDQAARFWFYAGRSKDPVETRKQLLAWQDRTGVTLPFIFLAEGREPTSASWALLAPFLKDVTHVGESMPRSQREAKAAGLYWCTPHETEAKLRQYSGLLAELGGRGQPKQIDLRGEPLFDLRRGMKDVETNLWLAGAWTDSGLRGVKPLPNKEWVDPKACNARVTFLSAYPVSAPIPGRFYETTAHAVIGKRVPELHRAARDGKAFFQVEEALTAFYKELAATGGLVAVSSCGKYLIISE